MCASQINLGFLLTGVCLKKNTQSRTFRKYSQPNNLHRNWKCKTLKWIFLNNRDKANLGNELCGWETEQISKRNGGIVERPMKDRGKDAHQYDSLFGKCMLYYCLRVPLTSIGKNMWLETGLDEGKGRTRLTHSFHFSSLLKEKPMLWENGLILAAVTHFYTFILELWYAHSHTYTHPYAHTCCNASVKRKTEASGKVVLWEALTWFAGAHCVSHNFGSAVLC